MRKTLAILALVAATPLIGQGMQLPGQKDAARVTAGTYNPLARPLFIYVSAKAVEKPEVKEYVEFIMTKGAPLVAEVKYLPLPAPAYATALKHFKDGRKGTVFGGVPEVGVSVEDLMKRDAKN